MHDARPVLERILCGVKNFPFLSAVFDEKFVRNEFRSNPPPYAAHPVLRWFSSPCREFHNKYALGLEKALKCLDGAKPGGLAEVKKNLIADRENWSSTISEIRLAAEFARRGYAVELQPKVPGSTSKRSDIKVTLPTNSSVFVEVYSPVTLDTTWELEWRIHFAWQEHVLARSSKPNYDLRVSSSKSEKVEQCHMNKCICKVLKWLANSPDNLTQTETVYCDKQMGLSVVARPHGSIGDGSAQTHWSDVPSLDAARLQSIVECKAAEKDKNGQFPADHPTIFAVDLTYSGSGAQLALDRWPWENAHKTLTGVKWELPPNIGCLLLCLFELPTERLYDKRCFPNPRSNSCYSALRDLRLGRR